ncbi:MAG: M20/M25/M40 family metallo-hydrolase, partial [Nannocystaceae bacterium]
MIASSIALGCGASRRGGPESAYYPEGVPVVQGQPAAQYTPPAPPTPAIAPPMVVEDPLPPLVVEAATLLSQVGVTDQTAWERLAFMVDEFGTRLSGSDGLEKTIDWAVATMKADGLTNARRESVMVNRWERGSESATVIKPREKELYMLGLGNSVGTPRRGIKAEVVLVPDVAAIDALGGKAKGKIVAVTQAMPQYDHEHDTSHYGEAVQPRIHAASRAAKLGAKAVLIRSVTATNYRLPHTGTLRYAEDAPKIPAAALSPEDMMYLQRVAQRDQKIEVLLKMGARTLPDRESANAVAELLGREHPEEIVVIGCHLDAWDVGDGAHDDGAGCMMAMEAARVLQALGIQPARTIRVVLFTNEENGGAGARAYFEAHKNEPHVGAIEADAGSFAPKGFGIGATQEDVDALAPYAR